VNVIEVNLNNDKLRTQLPEIHSLLGTIFLVIIWGIKNIIGNSYYKNRNMAHYNLSKTS